MVSISKTNVKMGGIPSISFPPVVTCANCGECQKKCYAKKMANFRKSIGLAWARNLEEWKSNPDAVKYAIISNAITSSYFRFFVGGDIPDYNFLLCMVEVANTCKNTRFLAFTKKYNIVNNYIEKNGDLPSNLQIIFSGWGNGLKPVNPYKLPESDVIFKGEQEPKNAKICGGNCVDCICKGIACWELKKGEKIYFYEH